MSISAQRATLRAGVKAPKQRTDSRLMCAQESRRTSGSGTKEVLSETIRLAQGLLRSLDLVLPVPVLILDLGWNLLQQLLGEDSEEFPGHVQRVEHITVLVRSLSNELLLELVGKFEVFVLIIAQSLFTNN